MRTVVIRLSVAVVTFITGTLANFALRPTPVVVRSIPQTTSRASVSPSCAQMLNSYLDRGASAYERTQQSAQLSDLECYGGAATLLEEAIRQDSSYTEAYGDLGYLYNSLSRFEEATAVLEKGLRLAPEDAYMNNELAYAQNAMENPSAAIEALRRVVSLDADDAYAHAALSESYQQLKQRERALDLARKAVTLGAENDDEPALDNASYALLDMGYPDEAEAAIRQALRSEPDSLYAQYTLGAIRAANGERDAARQSFSLVVAERPESPYEHLMRAWARLYLADACGASREARQYLEMVEWKGHNVAEAGVLAYVALRRAGRDEEAQGILEEAARHTDTASFEWQLLDCMRGNLSEEKLFAKAKSSYELTAAHGYLGLKDALGGRTPGGKDVARASSNIEWVRTKGSKQFTAYACALDAKPLFVE